MTDDVPATSINANKLEALAQAHEGEAFALLVEMIRDPEVKPEHRLRAAESIMDRARGKARQPVQKEPAQRKQKAVQMSVETLLKIAQGAVARTEQADRNRVEAKALEGEFVPVVRKRPVNQYALPAPIVPGTNDVEDLLS